MTSELNNPRTTRETMKRIKIPTSREQTIAEALFAMAGLDEDKLVFNASFEQWKTEIKRLLGTYDRIDRTILSKADKEFGVSLTEKTEDGFNYKIKVRRSDGVTVTILIPVEGNCEHIEWLNEREHEQ